MCNTKGFLLLVILVVAVSSEKPSKTEGDSDLTATKVGKCGTFLSFRFFSCGASLLSVMSSEITHESPCKSLEVEQPNRTIT